MKKVIKNKKKISFLKKLSSLFTNRFNFLLLSSLACVALVILSIYGTKRFFPLKVKANSNPITHIIWIQKENHSFDDYFGAYPGVNGATTGKVNINGVMQTVPLNSFQDQPTTDYNHGFGNAQMAYDKGAMDKFNQGPCATAPYPCYEVAQRSDLPNYWQYADNFVLNDNAFSALIGPSFPNHLYAVGGASGPNASQSAVANPLNASGKWGCDAPAGASVKLLNGTTQFPCMTGITTLADEMTNNGISWKYYAPQVNETGYIWNSLDAVQQDSTGSARQNDVPWQQFTSDVANNQLPQFSWIIPPGSLSEHPAPTTGSQYGSGNSMCAGENWTVQQINAIMSNPAYQNNTAIILSWDDYGGYYDHVAPQQVDKLGYGFRVPMMIISPYAYAMDNPANPHVSHTKISFGSVLRFAEETFNLPSLNTRDSVDNDLASEFDFSQVHNQPLILPTRTCPGATTPTPTLTPTPIVTSTPTPTPVAGTVVAQDTFQRPNQTLWGTASDGHVWGADANKQSGFSIMNNVGQIAETTNTSMNAILGPSVANEEVLMSGSMTALGSTNSIGAAVRWNSAGNFYKALINGTKLILQKNISGAVTQLGSSSFTAAANTFYAIRFNVTGTTLSAKAWNVSASEPSNWMVTATDSSITSGFGGIRMLQQSGTTSTVTSFTATSQ